MDVKLIVIVNEYSFENVTFRNNDSLLTILFVANTKKNLRVTVKYWVLSVCPAKTVYRIKIVGRVTIHLRNS